jgi:hypothetical protein
MPIPQLPAHAARPDRQDKRTIAFHVDIEIFRRFAYVKAKLLATTQDLGVIAVDMLIKTFAPEIDQPRSEADAAAADAQPEAKSQASARTDHTAMSGISH